MRNPPSLSWLCVQVFSGCLHSQITNHELGFNPLSLTTHTHTTQDLRPSWRSGTCWSCRQYGQRVERVFFGRVQGQQSMCRTQIHHARLHHIHQHTQDLLKCLSLFCFYLKNVCVNLIPGFIFIQLNHLKASKNYRLVPDPKQGSGLSGLTDREQEDC